MWDFEDAARVAQARHLRFDDELEPLFLEEYYVGSIGLSRAALACSALLFGLFGFLDPYAIPGELHRVWFLRFGVVMPALLGVLALSFTRVFRRIMQMALAFVIIVTGLGLIAMTMLARPDELGFLLYPMGLLLVPIVGYCFVRLRFWYATVSNLFNVIAYVAAAIGFQHILATPRGAASIISQVFFIGAVNVVGIAACYSLELFARRAFLASFLLEQERDQEVRERERTQGKLNVLSQAIGGIVHDLGNPLTSVQVGAQTMDLYLDSGLSSPEELKELTQIINEGAEMLNHLRVSLMEQTRVLQGKPIPLDRQPTALRPLIVAGVGFQQPRWKDQRTITLVGDEAQVEADALKLTTVWMNLIGNALKYSDGEVRIVWRIEGAHLLVAVCDEGRDGRGLSREGANQLFVPFARLEAHANITGTGLGLLSARRIVEAHGGEAFIEGYDDGSRDSPIFSTAQGDFPSMLHAPFLTAFVVALPLRASLGDGRAPALEPQSVAVTGVDAQSVDHPV